MLGAYIVQAGTEELHTRGWYMNIFGLAVSGRDQTGVLFDLRTTGHPLLTGGDYGPEGSLITTAVFLLGIVVVIMTCRVQEKIRREGRC